MNNFDVLTHNYRQSSNIYSNLVVLTKYMDPLQHLHWRYAVKRYNPALKLNEDQVNLLLESIRLTPTSLGLQSFKVWALGPDSPHREAMKPLLNNQPQSVEASHLFIFAAQINIGAEDVQAQAERTAAARNQDIRELDRFVQGVSSYIEGQTEEERLNWAHKQSYIALGLVMAEAARAGIDATPMEGFKHDELDAYFKLNEQGFASSVILAAGFRDSENDFLANLAKVRKTQSELIVFV
jgi:nitroreductase